jgi:hypothetical protein
MTGRVTAVLAAVAGATAVLALAVHPFLHGSDATPRPRVTRAELRANPRAGQVESAATAAARQALACRPSPRAGLRPTRPGACGRLVVTRRQTDCSTAVRCRVDLIGTLTTTDTTAVVGLTVTVQRHAMGWTAVAVTS